MIFSLIKINTISNAMKSEFYIYAYVLFILLKWKWFKTRRDRMRDVDVSKANFYTVLFLCNSQLPFL